MNLVIDIQDELSRLQSALTLVQMACDGPCIAKEASDALSLGIDHAMQHAIQIGTQLDALRSGEAA